jgi:hypothetical protein
MLHVFVNVPLSRAMQAQPEKSFPLNSSIGFVTGSAAATYAMQMRQAGRTAPNAQRKTRFMLAA